MRLACVLALAMGLTTAANAQSGYPADGRAAIHYPVILDEVLDLNGETALGGDDGRWFPTLDCISVDTHSSADFGGGQFVAQGGFSEGEIAAASFTIPASAFPIRIISTEAIFATVGATTVTTTEWSMMIWEGTPDTGTLLFEFNSDDLILPHIILGPGSAGVNVQLSVDPGDPEQIFLFNADSSATFTVGYRIDKHNSQTANPCFTAPPQTLNAFPTTDTGGLGAASQNWLFGLNCGPFGCPANGGWSTFAALPGLCRPSGDWNIRVTWESVNCNPDTGACCLTDGTCLETDAANCDTLNGTYQGDDTLCAQITCPEPTEACCFEDTGGCLDLEPGLCALAGGIAQGPGTDCASTICFPIGAVCLPDGTCIDGVTPEEAQMMGGVFQGDGTTCATVVCPEPTGAACFSNGACLILTEAQATIAGASWAGPGTTCDDANMNGTADACEADCTGDIADDFGTIGPDGMVGFGDFLALLGLVGPCPGGMPGCTGDIADDFGTVGNEDGMVGFGDFLALLGLVGPCP